jgi:hypothetical protein
MHASPAAPPCFITQPSKAASPPAPTHTPPCAGGYDDEESAAKAHDVMAIKCRQEGRPAAPRGQGRGMPQLHRTTGTGRPGGSRPDRARCCSHLGPPLTGTAVKQCYDTRHRMAPGHPRHPPSSAPGPSSRPIPAGPLRPSPTLPCCAPPHPPAANPRGPRTILNFLVAVYSDLLALMERVAKVHGFDAAHTYGRADRCGESRLAFWLPKSCHALSKNLQH